MTAAKLVIGYGNTLRGDDGIGPRVAAALEAAGLPGVTCLATHQLTPELAEPLARARVAIFVDAYAADADGTVQVQALTPHAEPGVLGHTGDPGALLAMARALYGASPAAWWVMVPGVNFGVGERLSSTAADAVPVAMTHVNRLLRSDGGA
jgi:hydrogenase maturation protease